MTGNFKILAKVLPHTPFQKCGHATNVVYFQVI